MPVHVEHRPGQKRPWVIVETGTGIVKGTSTNQKDANISAYYRNRAISENPHPAGGSKKK